MSSDVGMPRKKPLSRRIKRAIRRRFSRLSGTDVIVERGTGWISTGPAGP